MTVFLICTRYMDLLPNGTTFIVFCFVLRVIQAVGGTAADVASFAIVAGEFRNSLGTVMVRNVKVLVYGTTVLLQLDPPPHPKKSGKYFLFNSGYEIYSPAQKVCNDG